MKKLIAIYSIFVLALTFSACTKQSTESQDTDAAEIQEDIQDNGFDQTIHSDSEGSYE